MMENLETIFYLIIIALALLQKGIYMTTLQNSIILDEEYEIYLNKEEALKRIEQIEVINELPY